MIDVIPYAGTLPDSFFEIPPRVYAADPLQPPEDRAQVEALFREESTRHDVTLLTDHRHLRLVGIFPHDEPETAFFGFWETTNDDALNRAAFARLTDDARRRGRQYLVGPLNFNTFQSYRLRLGGVPSWGRFDREPAQPAYYPALLDGLGFRVRQTFESRLIRPEAVPLAFGQKAALLEALAQIPFDFIPLHADSWRAHEADLFALVQAIFSANPGYRPVSFAQFRRLYHPDYAAGLCPQTSVLFRDRASGRLAALSWCLPNYAPLGLGTELPVFERDFPRLPEKILLAKTVGVHPDFRRRGLMNFLGAYGMVHFRERYEKVIFCLMRSDNASLHFSDSLPHETARYGLFEQALTF